MDALENYEFLLARLKEYELAPTWCEVIRRDPRKQPERGTSPSISYSSMEIILMRASRVTSRPSARGSASSPWWSSMIRCGKGGAPRLLDELRQQGYHSVTVNFGPGLTLLRPTVGGTPFLEVLTKRFEDESRSPSVVG